jgi:hypothetical protein
VSYAGSFVFGKCSTSCITCLFNHCLRTLLSCLTAGRRERTGNNLIMLASTPGATKELLWCCQQILSMLQANESVIISAVVGVASRSPGCCRGLGGRHTGAINEEARLLPINNAGATICQRVCCDKRATTLPSTVEKLPMMFSGRIHMIFFLPNNRLEADDGSGLFATLLFCFV